MKKDEIKPITRSAISRNTFQKVQAEMDDLCANIHNFYDNLETQKNVFLYHGAALKIAQNFTPRFVSLLDISCEFFKRLILFLHMTNEL